MSNPPTRRTGRQPKRFCANGLQARDNNVLDVVRKGESLSLEQWADFFLENYSKPPVRAVTWSDQRRIESHAPPHLRNVIQIITETGLRVYKELTPMRKDQVDLNSATVWIPDSKTPNGIGEIPLTRLAVEAFKCQMRISRTGVFVPKWTRTPPAIRGISRRLGGKHSNAREFAISGFMT